MDRLPDVYRITAPQRHALLAGAARMARSLPERLIGLLGHERLAEGEGLILPNCRSVHTWFMRFPIDLVFVDARWRVVALGRRMGPWRLSAWVWRAWAVVELAAGTIDRVRLEAGDQLAAEPAEAA